jgi:hypothetical protein
LLCVTASLSFRLTSEEGKKDSSPPLSSRTLALAADEDDRLREQNDVEHGYGGAARASGPAVAAVEDSSSSRWVTREDMVLKEVKQGNKVAEFKAQHQNIGTSVAGQ